MAAAVKVTVVDRRTLRVAMETDRYRIVGTFTLPREGYMSRLSDFINQDAEFLALTDAELWPLEGGEPTREQFIAVSRRHIRTVVPIEG